VGLRRLASAPLCLRQGEPTERLQATHVQGQRVLPRLREERPGLRYAPGQGVRGP
jgi:hypothetical protein